MAGAPLPGGNEAGSDPMSPLDQEPPSESPAAFSDLRVFRIFQHVPDEKLTELAWFAREQLIGRGQVIYNEGDLGDDFFVVLEGATEDFCTLLAGRQPVSRARVGQILGEPSFLDGRPRPTTAVAMEKGALLRFNSAGLQRLLATRHDLGAALSRAFWHSLAGKIRQANEFMTEMVPLAEADERSDRVPGRSVELKPGAKVDLFQESGLSAAELRLLATTLHAQHFAPDAYIFHEQETGDSLYIVFDGEVRISRQMSGRGEEPLAIIRRGEVFGEMALVDDQPRSADARAHTEGCTALVLSQADLDAVLHMPPPVASQFLYLVCGVLCHRLRAMIGLLASWRTRTSIGQEDLPEEEPREE
jgi:CRP/FNR family cyclic AMP-dependent transcriptional regulator